MKVHLVSYATIEYKKSQNELIESALVNGVDNVFRYNRTDLVKTKFYQENKRILDERKGGGYWLWKPYYILETLNSISDNDILLYADAGATIIIPVTPLVDLCLINSIVVFANGGGYTNAQYTKRDCFKLLNCDSAIYHNAPHVTASFQLYKKTDKAIGFITEWLNLCRIPQALTDAVSTLGNELPNFIAHRHDQSILSLLAHKHNLLLFRDPSQFGESLKGYTNSSYGNIFDHHRRRNLTLTEKIMRFLK